MNLTFAIFIFAVLIAFILLIVHSYLHRGIKETLLFFGFGFVFGLIREIIYRTFFNNYSVSEVPLQILGAPLAIIFGWLFTYYLGYSLCESFMKDASEPEYLRLMILSALFSSFICFSIETAAMYLGWWEVFFESSEFAASDLLAGWFYSALLYFSIFFILLGKIKKKKNLILPFLIIFLITIIEFTEVLYFTFQLLLINIIYFTILTIICIIFPFLSIFLIPLGILFFIGPTRDLLNNNGRIIIFFIVEFAYLYILLKKPKIVEIEAIE
ncbi:MAG: hypothetical protein GF383_06180 [Candidatus Lokiarchaeota archaeon]|nr:hypothetical protein [Candidatus Lokiarchaeota archaeon]MBD3339540.1 hypothetical protein [Candidatus Lokiarchaeota archaeon]